MASSQLSEAGLEAATTLASWKQDPTLLASLEAEFPAGCDRANIEIALDIVENAGFGPEEGGRKRRSKLRGGMSLKDLKDMAARLVKRLCVDEPGKVYDHAKNYIATRMVGVSKEVSKVDTRMLGETLGKGALGAMSAAAFFVVSNQLSFDTTKQLATIIANTAISAVPENALKGYYGLAEIASTVFGIAIGDIQKNPGKYISLVLAYVITNKIKNITSDAWNGTLVRNLTLDAMYLLTGNPEYREESAMTTEEKNVSSAFDQYMAQAKAIKDQKDAAKKAADKHALEEQLGQWRAAIARLDSAPALRDTFSNEDEFSLGSMYKRLSDAGRAAYQRSLLGPGPAMTAEQRSSLSLLGPGPGPAPAPSMFSSMLGKRSTYEGREGGRTQRRRSKRRALTRKRINRRRKV